MSLKPSLTRPHQNIEFIDLAAQQRAIKSKIDAGIAKVLAHGAYIMGPEVNELEKRLSDFCGAPYSVSCSNGTDALALVLMAMGVKPRDAIFCPSFTFAATAEVIAWLGATPVFVDSLESTFNIDPENLESGIAHVKSLGLNPKGIIPVDLFGLPADYDAIDRIAKEHGLWVLCDAAQGFGGSYHGKNVGTFGHATSTSFFPAKPLGCYGDGGAVFTADSALYEKMCSLRVHGKGQDKYDNVHIGMNGRLDTIQAAILLEKLKIFPAEIEARNRLAARYENGLADVVRTPQVPAGLRSVWAQYTLLLSDGLNRDEIQSSLKKEYGVPTMVYYPKPLHQQTAYRQYPTATGRGLDRCESLSRRVLSLPMHPYMQDNVADYIIASVRAVLLAAHQKAA